MSASEIDAIMEYEAILTLEELWRFYGFANLPNGLEEITLRLL